MSEGKKKSEVRSPKSEVKKPGSKKAEVESWKPEEEHSGLDIPQSEVKPVPTANLKLPQRSSLEQTEKMEVHHHPQLDHKPKPWKEYILEGLMIFLAVTMGFFAESLREHIGNNEREKQIIASLVRDIKKDTAKLNDLIYTYMPAHNRWTDSANKYIDSLPLKVSERKITMAVFNATDWNTYAPPEIALNVLKDAGAFNLIEKEKVKAEILNLNTNINEYIKYSAFVTEVEHKVDTASTSFIPRQVQRKVIAMLYINNAKNSNGFVALEDIPADIKFKTYNKAVFVNYLKRIDEVDNLLNDMLGQYKRVFNEETKLLNVLKEEYHLKDE